MLFPTIIFVYNTEKFKKQNKKTKTKEASSLDIPKAEDSQSVAVS